jgi:tRNA(fMet)-specific endonuclease VapC
VNLRYLLDTNVLSEPAKARPNPRVMERIRRHRSDLATASPVWHELLYGCALLPPGLRRQTLERYLHEALEPNLPVFPYDVAAAAWHAAERARLESKGKTPPSRTGKSPPSRASAGGPGDATSELRDLRRHRARGLTA